MHLISYSFRRNAHTKPAAAVNIAATAIRCSGLRFIVLTSLLLKIGRGRLQPRLDLSCDRYLRWDEGLFPRPQ